MKPALLGPVRDDTTVDRSALLTTSIPWKTQIILVTTATAILTSE